MWTNWPIYSAQSQWNISAACVEEIYKLILKYIRELGGLRTANLKNRRTKLEASHFSISKLKATVIRTVWCWYTDRHTYRQKRTESREINVYVYGQMVGDKTLKKIGKNSLFNKWCLNNLIATCKKMNLDPS